MRNSYKNLSASGAVIPGEGVLESMYVNTTGSMILYASPSAATNTGAIISTATVTPAIGYHCLGHIHSTAGVYCSISSGNTLNVTFHIKEV
jgi:hypothetical protein